MTKKVKYKQKHVVLTVDYEIFGNGTGSVKDHMIKPMDDMMDTAKKYDVPLTIFFEVEEYIAFRKYQVELEKLLGYNPAKLIHKQVKKMVHLGHDIQLHIHPQWYEASLENGKWKLNFKYSKIDDLFVTQEEVNQYIYDRKKILEDIIREEDKKNEIIAFRAGAFCAQPGIKLINALDENEIVIDSSVVKGLSGNGILGTYDYRPALKNGNYWRVSDDVANESSIGNVTEIPIYSVMKRRWNQITIKKLKAKFSKNVPLERQKEMLLEIAGGNNLLGIIVAPFKKVPIKLDYHNLNAKQIKSFIEKDTNNYVYVLIGHTKEHNKNSHLDKTLRILTDMEGVILTTLSKCYENLDKIPIV